MGRDVIRSISCPLWLLSVAYVGLLIAMCSAATIRANRKDYYIQLAVESNEPVDVQVSTNLVNWRTTDLVYFYGGIGWQTNHCSVIDSNNCFFRLVMPATNASFSVLTSADIPRSNYVAYRDGGLPASMVWSNDCLTAVISYKVPFGSWRVERNADLRGKRNTSSTCIEGDDWLAVSQPIVGPSTGTITLALPKNPPGFLRIRRL